MSRGNFLIITPERLADHLERLVNDPAELREQVEAQVLAQLRGAEISARMGAVVLRRIRDKQLYVPSGWPSWHDFCAYFSPQEPERIDIFIKALEVLESRGEKCDFGEPEARALTGHGGDRGNQHTGGKSQGAEAPCQRGSDSNAYWRGRLARDRPDVLARLAAGEFKSARQAAIAVDLKKVPTPYDVMVSGWRRGSDHDRMRFEEFFAQRAVVAADHAEELRPTVLAGESSPHPTVIVPLDVELAAARLRQHFVPEDRARLASLLVGEDDPP
jgi:hypothetical protein